MDDHLHPQSPRSDRDSYTNQSPTQTCEADSLHIASRHVDAAPKDIPNASDQKTQAETGDWLEGDHSSQDEDYLPSIHSEEDAEREEFMMYPSIFDVDDDFLPYPFEDFPHHEQSHTPPHRHVDDATNEQTVALPPTVSNHQTDEGLQKQDEQDKDELDGGQYSIVVDAHGRPIETVSSPSEGWISHRTRNALSLQNYMLDELAAKLPEDEPLIASDQEDYVEECIDETHLSIFDEKSFQTPPILQKEFEAFLQQVNSAREKEQKPIFSTDVPLWFEIKAKWLQNIQRREKSMEVSSTLLRFLREIYVPIRFPRPETITRQFFTTASLKRLRNQILDYTQLSCQQYLISRMSHSTHDIAIEARNSLLELRVREDESPYNVLRDCFHLFKIIPQSLMEPKDIASDAHMITNHVLDSFQSLYSAPLIRHIGEFFENSGEPISHMQKRYNTKDSLTKPSDVPSCLKPSDIISIIKRYEGHFAPYLAITRIQTNSKSCTRLKFTSAEDELLLHGLNLYSTNWEAIQLNLLPAKSIPQITHRFKNQTSRRAPDNPIKRFKEQQTLVLSDAEIALLRQAVAEYGPSWDKICQEYFPSYSAYQLKRYWDSNPAVREVKSLPPCPEMDLGRSMSKFKIDPLIRGDFDPTLYSRTPYFFMQKPVVSENFSGLYSLLEISKPMQTDNGPIRIHYSDNQKLGESDLFETPTSTTNQIKWVKSHPEMNFHSNLRTPTNHPTKEHYKTELEAQAKSASPSIQNRDFQSTHTPRHEQRPMMSTPIGQRLVLPDFLSVFPSPSLRGQGFLSRDDWPYTTSPVYSRAALDPIAIPTHSLNQNQNQTVHDGGSLSSAPTGHADPALRPQQQMQSLQHNHHTSSQQDIGTSNRSYDAFPGSFPTSTEWPTPMQQLTRSFERNHQFTTPRSPHIQVNSSYTPSSFFNTEPTHLGLTTPDVPGPHTVASSVGSRLFPSPLAPALASNERALNHSVPSAHSPDIPFRLLYEASQEVRKQRPMGSALTTPSPDRLTGKIDPDNSTPLQQYPANPEHTIGKARDDTRLSIERNSFRNEPLDINFHTSHQISPTILAKLTPESYATNKHFQPSAGQVDAEGDVLGLRAQPEGERIEPAGMADGCSVTESYSSRPTQTLTAPSVLGHYTRYEEDGDFEEEDLLDSDDSEDDTQHPGSSKYKHIRAHSLAPTQDAQTASAPQAPQTTIAVASVATIASNLTPTSTCRTGESLPQTPKSTQTIPRQLFDDFEKEEILESSSESTNDPVSRTATHPPPETRHQTQTKSQQSSDMVAHASRKPHQRESSNKQVDDAKKDSTAQGSLTTNPPSKTNHESRIRPRSDGAGLSVDENEPDEKRQRRQQEAPMARSSTPDNQLNYAGSLTTWTKEQDRCLLLQVKATGVKPLTWAKVSEDPIMEGRSCQVIEGRFKKLLQLMKQK
eukprot:TRINITY_DN3994_c0_g2_i1.p1 TRINITY_DN3994_c0_g2~~TRINITY_DN3994_c0_g2_i1.p1  ORF type:complete len:1432 (+),score=253.95 TRINITY_DN3994_c0_g2_i1:90-4385(+)